MSEKLLVLQSVDKVFKDRLILKSIDLTVYRQEIICVLGPSGIGKTTILNMLAGCETITQGQVQRFTDKIGYVFQEDRLMPWLNVFENIRLIAPHVDQHLIWESLQSVGLRDFARYYPHELSGGMRQRASIARALTYGGEVLCLDEPFKSLDYRLRQELLDLLVDLKQTRHVSSLLITHDIEEALYIADRILVINGAPASVVLEVQLPSSSDLSPDILYQLQTAVGSLNYLQRQQRH